MHEDYDAPLMDHVIGELFFRDDHLQEGLGCIYIAQILTKKWNDHPGAAEIKPQLEDALRSYLMFSMSQKFDDQPAELIPTLLYAFTNNCLTYFWKLGPPEHRVEYFRLADLCAFIAERISTDLEGAIDDAFDYSTREEFSFYLSTDAPSRRITNPPPLTDDSSTKERSSPVWSLLQGAGEWDLHPSQVDVDSRDNSSGGDPQIPFLRAVDLSGFPPKRPKPEGLKFTASDELRKRETIRASKTPNLPPLPAALRENYSPDIQADIIRPARIFRNPIKQLPKPLRIAAYSVLYAFMVYVSILFGILVYQHPWKVLLSVVIGYFALFAVAKTLDNFGVL